MTSSALTFLLICTLLATVSGQSSIVSTNTISSGGKFTVTCDHSRVNPPQNVYSVSSLAIYRNLTTTNSYSLISKYNSRPPPGLAGNVTNITSGRNWTIIMNGGNDGASNLQTMRIVWDINDVSCADAGIYRCVIEYFLASGSTSTPVQSPDQNVTATTGLSRFELTVSQPSNNNEYNVDDNITFTCSALGPAAGVNFKWELWAKDQFDMEQPQTLPYNYEIVNKSPTPQGGNTGAGCAQYSWVSTLGIQVPVAYEQQSYKCIVTYMQQEESGNFTIGTAGGLTPRPQAASTGGTPPNVGMIVGIIIGCLVAIALVIGIIFFIRYRKRSQENRSGNKDQHDAPNDANLNAPPPVFYPSSKKTKASKDEDTKIPTGMTNDALDTSYDSRDSVSKGPPRYANAESDAQGPPRYEREAVRGRQNRAYDEEERERNERNDKVSGHGRRQPREDRKHRSRDYDEDEPRHRYYTTDDGTDNRVDLGDPNMGTSI